VSSDFDNSITVHENQVELGTIQTEFKVQMEIELKRQAADIALEHENEIKNLKTEYEQKITEKKSEQKSAVLEKSEAVEEPVIGQFEVTMQIMYRL
jgi:predicted GIY-YIG superfamily endonuclease